MFDFDPFLSCLAESRLNVLVDDLKVALTGAVANPHGDLSRWETAVRALPAITPSYRDLSSRVAVGQPADISSSSLIELERQLHQLHPWRKGPFELFGLLIDTEWRSDWKWERLRPHISPVEGRLVLDVGCGNGYFGWRMLGAGAKLVMGLDPMWLYVSQFFALQSYIGGWSTAVLPLPFQQFPAAPGRFDSVFSMGVLYHMRSPFEHLIQLRDALRPGGELVLETLVTKGPRGHVLVPEGRYAQMRNVWCLPTPSTLESWLRKCGFKDIRVVDVTPTTTREQRSTDWMRFHSLAEFLDPENPSLTTEGHPAPIRAILLATAP